MNVENTWESRTWPRNNTASAQRRTLMLALLQNTGTSWGSYVLSYLGLSGEALEKLLPRSWGERETIGKQQVDVFGFLGACISTLQQRTGDSEADCAHRVMEAALVATVDAIEMRWEEE